MGHRKRLYAALTAWSHELGCSSQAIVGDAYGNRVRPGVRRCVSGRLRAWQKAQDRREYSQGFA